MQTNRASTLVHSWNCPLMSHQLNWSRLSTRYWRYTVCLEPSRHLLHMHSRPAPREQSEEPTPYAFYVSEEEVTGNLVDTIQSKVQHTTHCRSAHGTKIMSVLTPFLLDCHHVCRVYQRRQCFPSCTSLCPPFAWCLSLGAQTLSQVQTCTPIPRHASGTQTLTHHYCRHYYHRTHGCSAACQLFS